MLECIRPERLSARERVGTGRRYFVASPYSHHGPLETLPLLESCFFLAQQVTVVPVLPTPSCHLVFGLGVVGPSPRRVSCRAIIPLPAIAAELA
jgi:hypothetical protein